jgi:hypothetical protein
MSVHNRMGTSILTLTTGTGQWGNARAGKNGASVEKERANRQAAQV